MADLKFTLEPASFTAEKYELHKRYQEILHNDPPSKITERGFTSFLVDSPLSLEPIASANSTLAEPERFYGSHHGLYYLDNRLIAFAVLDVLPGAISSVYLVWDPDYSGLGLGKLSALREIGMTREFGMERYMMGYYIPNCQKM